jgi:cysteine desulfurase family protein
MIYLDNAATSWPKPPAVIRAMADYLERAGGNPGRSGHRLSVAAGRVVEETRDAVAQLFRVANPVRVVFTHNATYALNLAVRGLLRPGDRAVVTSMDHNAVMRPLRALERKGVALTVVPDLPAIERAAPGARLIVAVHANNITSELAPISECARVAHAAGAMLLVDAAQSAGAVPIDVPGMGIDLLAFTGHKGLLGPTGTGGLVLGEGIDAAALEPLVCGGTGSRSEWEEQPEFLPDRFESGTANGLGLAGLGAGVREVLERGVEAIRAHERRLAGILLEGLSSIPKVKLYGPLDPDRRLALVSFTVEGRRVSEVGLRLDEEFGILCRVGLHCAPSAHRALGTFPEGTVRLAPGPFTKEEEVRAAVAAVARIAGS